MKYRVFRQVQRILLALPGRIRLGPVCLGTVSLALLAPPAWADGPWQFLIAVGNGGPVTWAAVLAGIIVESLFVCRIMKRSWGKGLVPTLAANVVSMLNPIDVGSLMYITLLQRGMQLSQRFTDQLGWSSQSANAYLALLYLGSWLVEALMDTVIEYTVLAGVWKTAWSRKGFGSLLLANLISVAIAFVAIWYNLAGHR